MPEDALPSSQHLIERIMDAIPVRVFWKDKNLNYLGCNLIFAHDAGFSDPKDIIGKNDYQLIWAEKADTIRKDDLQIIESGNVRLNTEETLVTNDGNTINILASKLPLLGNKGETIGVLGTYKDITVRKRAQLDIIRAKEKAEEISRMKTNFLANMSHEIRTPLNGILGFTELLKEEIKEKEHQDFLCIIEKSCNRLMETLNLILNYSKLEAEMLSANYTDKNINEVVSEVADSFEAMAKMKNLFLKKDIVHKTIISKTDERFLRDILNNLVKNAIVYTNEGGLTVSLDKVDNDMIIKVKDTGVGIGKENFDMIFEPFRQESEGWGRNFEGTGLGLSITKRIVEKMQGKIEVESEIGKGSTFTVRLPYIEETEAPPEETNRKPVIEEIKNLGTKPDKKHLSVLLVDDDETNLLYTLKILDHNYRTDTAIDGYKAIEKAEKKHYDIILMDINLGKGIDGIQAVSVIRKIKGYEKTPIVALTAFASENDKTEFLSSGCTHYLSKPFTVNQLLSLLTEISKEQ